MRVAIFTQRSGHQIVWAQAFAQGLERHGLKAAMHGRADVVECDLAVFWSHRRREVIARQKSAGRDYLVMERGYIGDRFRWTSLGYNGLNGRAEFCNQNVPGDRWKIFEHLMQPWKRGGDYALLLGQVPGDCSIEGVNFQGWLNDTAAALGRLGVPVRFRPHPMGGKGFTCPNGATLATGDLAAELAGAQAAITWNSNSGVEAVLAGVPTVAMDRGSMAWDVSGHEVGDLLTPDRQRWAERLAYCQWTTEEIAAGKAWDALKTYVDGRYD